MRFLITGASGQLGGYLLSELQGRADLSAWSGSSSGDLFGVPLLPVALTNHQDIATAFAAARPDVVIHCAALARIADCHRDPERARLVNVAATEVLVGLCSRARTRFVYVSTDLVFDGQRGRYREDDVPAPLSVYGRTKYAAEEHALTNPRGVVARVSLLYGPSLNGHTSFFDEQTIALGTGRNLTLFTDEWRTPLHLRTAATALVELALSPVTGVLHIGGPERLSRYEMGVRLAASLRADPSVINGVTQASMSAPEPRPRDVSLDSSRWRSIFPAIPWQRYLE